MSDVTLLGKEEKKQSSAPGFSSVGQILKYYRELKGLSLEQIAQKTHIKIKYLYSLEENLNEGMPAPVYIYSYIKQYAKLLGLEGAELVKLYQKQFGLPETRLSHENEDNVPHNKSNDDNIYLHDDINLSNQHDKGNGNGKGSMELDVLFGNTPQNKSEENSLPLNNTVSNVSVQQTEQVIQQPQQIQKTEEPEPVITQEIIDATAQAERILLNARREADKIVKDAREQARQFQHGAESYAISLLNSMEQELLGALSEVKNGRAFLRSQRR